MSIKSRIILGPGNNTVRIGKIMEIAKKNNAQVNFYNGLSMNPPIVPT